MVSKRRGGGLGKTIPPKKSNDRNNKDVVNAAVKDMSNFNRSNHENYIAFILTVLKTLPTLSRQSALDSLNKILKQEQSEFKLNAVNISSDNIQIGSIEQHLQMHELNADNKKVVVDAVSTMVSLNTSNKDYIVFIISVLKKLPRFSRRSALDFFNKKKKF